MTQTSFLPAPQGHRPRIRKLAPLRVATWARCAICGTRYRARPYTLRGKKGGINSAGTGGCCSKACGELAGILAMKGGRN